MNKKMKNGKTIGIFGLEVYEDEQIYRKNSFSFIIRCDYCDGDSKLWKKKGKYAGFHSFENPTFSYIGK